MNQIKFIASATAVAVLASSAPAALFNVTVTGNVDYNVIGGSMAGVQSGAPVIMSFDIDSDSPIAGSFPTLGYQVIDSSFTMTVDGRPISYDIPQPSPLYFVLRNNDPAIDGVFLSYGPDFDVPFGVHVPGLTAAHELGFSHTFANATTFSSLDIADAVGTYQLSTNVSSYLWYVGRFGNPGAEYAPASMTISAVPEPVSLSVLGLGILAVSRRKKK